MNKRVRELALQAGGSHYPEVNSMQLEKFAELIVRECMEINKQELAFNAFERLMNKYKEHFGVTE